MRARGVGWSGDAIARTRDLRTGNRVQDVESSIVLYVGQDAMIPWEVDHCRGDFFLRYCFRPGEELNKLKPQKTGIRETVKSRRNRLVSVRKHNASTLYDTEEYGRG